MHSRAPITFSCAHCILACPLHPCTPIAFSCPMHSRAPITFSCAHCILTCPLHPYTPIAFSCLIHSRGPTAFSCTQFTLVHPLHSGVPIALLYLYRILVLSLHRLYNNCIPVRRLHSHTPIAFSCTHCIPLRVNFFTFSSNTCHSHYS